MWREPPPKSSTEHCVCPTGRSTRCSMCLVCSPSSAMLGLSSQTQRGSAWTPLAPLHHWRTHSHRCGGCMRSCTGCHRPPSRSTRYVPVRQQLPQQWPPPPPPMSRLIGAPCVMRGYRMTCGGRWRGTVRSVGGEPTATSAVVSSGTTVGRATGTSAQSAMISGRRATTACIHPSMPVRSRSLLRSRRRGAPMATASLRPRLPSPPATAEAHGARCALAAWYANGLFVFTSWPNGTL
mmetsp:Transcript_39014/g.88610  ORF Transcript_39014/g.88610 Transcript_39014/m.88610 type:complete len:237 (+) Transcript_39014:367-1077(+)